MFTSIQLTVSRYTLLQVFTKFGKVSKLDYLFHKTGPLKGKPRGYAFVEFAHPNVRPFYHHRTSVADPGVLFPHCLHDTTIHPPWAVCSGGTVKPGVDAATRYGKNFILIPTCCAAGCAEST